MIPDPIVEAVCADLHRRSQVGIEKYGVTLDRVDFSLRDWLQHAYEETLDQANYLKCAIVKLDAEDVELDMRLLGIGIAKDGKRVDPLDFYVQPPEEPDHGRDTPTAP